MYTDPTGHYMVGIYNDKGEWIGQYETDIIVDENHPYFDTGTPNTGIQVVGSATVNNSGNTAAISVTTNDSVIINNSGSVGGVYTSNGSSATVNNSGSIEALNIGTSSTTIINNSGVIGTINTGSGTVRKSTTDITNTGTIGIINYGENSIDKIKNNGFIGNIIDLDHTKPIITGVGTLGGYAYIGDTYGFLTKVANWFTNDSSAIAGPYGILNGPNVDGAAKARFFAANWQEYLFGGYSDEKMEEARVSLFRQGILKSDPNYALLLNAQMRYWQEYDKPTWSKALATATGLGLGEAIRFAIVNVMLRKVVSNAEVRFAAGNQIQPMEKTLDMALNPEYYASQVAERYGVNLRGSGQKITIKFNPNLESLGKSAKSNPNVIEIGPQAFADEKTLANTIAHELNHARSWLKGGNAPESPAYNAGDMLQEYIEGGR